VKASPSLAVAAPCALVVAVVFCATVQSEPAGSVAVPDALISIV
jgi:hypothetical protein